MTNQNISSLERLMSDWHRRARESQFAHYEAVKPLVKANTSMGVVAVVLSTFVGTSLFATLEAQATSTYRIIIGFISVMAAVLSSLQTFLRYSERAEKHRAAAAKFGSLRREIEFLQATGAPYDMTRVETLRERIDSISSDAPEISERVWKKTESILKARSKEKNK
jgi:hypothetical protein